MGFKRTFVIMIAITVAASALFATSNGAWLSKVPEREHDKPNPYAGQSEAVLAGQRIFQDHCAHCHGDNAQGTKKRPSLRSDRVQQQATDGDLHWLLTNGNMGYGMPSWAKLGDPQVWQVIMYVKSLHVDQAAR